MKENLYHLHQSSHSVWHLTLNNWLLCCMIPADTEKWVLGAQMDASHWVFAASAVASSFSLCASSLHRAFFSMLREVRLSCRPAACHWRHWLKDYESHILPKLIIYTAAHFLLPVSPRQPQQGTPWWSVPSSHSRPSHALCSWQHQSSQIWKQRSIFISIEITIL